MCTRGDADIGASPPRDCGIHTGNWNSLSVPCLFFFFKSHFWCECVSSLTHPMAHVWWRSEDNVCKDCLSPPCECVPYFRSSGWAVISLGPIRVFFFKKVCCFYKLRISEMKKLGRRGKDGAWLWFRNAECCHSGTCGEPRILSPLFRLQALQPASSPRGLRGRNAELSAPGLQSRAKPSGLSRAD